MLTDRFPDVFSGGAALPVLPRRLVAAEPGWVETTDVVVVGSGIAGLTCALHLRESGLHVTVVTKVDIDDSATRWAQGGIAAALDPLDSPAAHARDTIVAGVGLCDESAVDALVTEGPTRVRELVRWGTRFDRHANGSLLLTREGGHHASRVVHAGGDATGAEVQRALHAAVRRDPWIRLVEHALVLDLLLDVAGRACGVTLHVLGEGTPDGTGAVQARAVVLATGGLGQVFSVTTNPVVSTGDGVALALRAGAVVTDIEFVQFHPTVFAAGGCQVRPAQRALITEALRGEGAHLVDRDGQRFMVGQHELAELAPRDVVAKASYHVMRASGADHVYLDARHLPNLSARFPTVTAACRTAGIDPVRDLIPVAPAAHYASGGVRTDHLGRTAVPGLYACGEVACTGVHGANRLASNSLLEALVFARRIAVDIAAGLPAHTDPVPAVWDRWVVPAGTRASLQQAMTQGAGVLRSAASLTATARLLEQLGSPAVLAGLDASGTHGTAETGGAFGAPDASDVCVGGAPFGWTDAWQATNLLTVASALVAAACHREETRGCHWRADHPTVSDVWRGHLLTWIGADGCLVGQWEPV